MRRHVALVLAQLMTPAGAQSDQPSLASQQFKTSLIATYGDKMMRPGIAKSVAGQNAPVDNVKVQLTISRYAQLDQPKQAFSFDSYLESYWFDERLAYNTSACALAGVPTCFDNGQRLLFSREEARNFWQPDFYSPNAADGQITVPGIPGKLTSESFSVRADGLVHSSQRATFHTQCPMDLSLMPFDMQECRMALSLYGYRSNEVNLTWFNDSTHTPIMDFFTLRELGAPPGWERATHRFMNALVPLPSKPGVPGVFSLVVAQFYFKRQPELWMYSYFFPSVMAVSMACLGFFIKNDAMPARAALGIVSMLISLTNLIALNRAIPPGGGSGDLPWLLYFVVTSFVWTGVAMLLLVFASFGQESVAFVDKQKKTVAAAQKNWQQHLLARPDAIIEVLEEWDDDGSRTVDVKELRRGIVALGIDATKQEVHELFTKLNPRGDASGEISFEELRSQMNNLIEDKDKKPSLSKGHTQRISTESFAAAPKATERSVSEDSEGAHAEEDSSDHTRIKTVEVSEVSISDVESGGKPRVSTGDVAREEPAGVIRRTANKTAKATAKATATSVSLSAKMVTVDKKTAATKKYQQQLQRELLEEVDKGRIWYFRTFILGPLLARLRFLDIPARALFPIGYAIYVIVSYNKVIAASHAQAEGY